MIQVIKDPMLLKQKEQSDSIASMWTALKEAET